SERFQIGVQRMRLGQRFDPVGKLGQCGLVVGCASDQCQGNDVGDFFEGLGTKTAGGQRRCADTQPSGDHRWAWVPRDSIAIDGDVDFLQQVFTLFAIEFRVAQVYQHQVNIGATRQYRNSSVGYVLLG